MVSNSGRRSSSSVSPREAGGASSRRSSTRRATPRDDQPTRPSISRGAPTPRGADERPRRPRGEARGQSGRGDASGRPTARGRTSDPRLRSFDRRMRAFLLSVVAVALAIIVVVLCVWSPLFQIRSISVEGSCTHVSAEQVTQLAAVPAGATLFGYDESGVAQRLLSDPWVADVTLTRSLPDTLIIQIEERTLGAIVMLSNGTQAWRLSTDGVWLEEVELAEVTSDNGADAYDVQAKNAAASEGVVFVSEASAALVPKAGEQCQDEGLLGLLQYMSSFSSELRDQVVSATATNKESIAVVLTSGIKVSLGAPDDISLKEQAALGILSAYQGQVSYINVRVPSKPTYRAVSQDAAASADDSSTVDSLPYQAQDAQDATAQADTAQADTAQADTAQADAAQAGGDASQDDANASQSSSDVPSDAAYNGGYYLDDGTWVNYFWDADGNLVHGYYDSQDEWVDLG